MPLKETLCGHAIGLLLRRVTLLVEALCGSAAFMALIEKVAMVPTKFSSIKTTLLRKPVYDTSLLAALALYT